MKNNVPYVAYRMAQMIEIMAQSPLAGRITHFAVRQYQGCVYLIWSDSDQGQDCFHVERPVSEWRRFVSEVMKHYDCDGVHTDELDADESFLSLNYANQPHP